MRMEVVSCHVFDVIRILFAYDGPLQCRAYMAFSLGLPKKKTRQKLGFQAGDRFGYPFPEPVNASVFGFFSSSLICKAGRQKSSRLLSYR